MNMTTGPQLTLVALDDSVSQVAKRLSAFSPTASLLGVIESLWNEFLHAVEDAVDSDAQEYSKARDGCRVELARVRQTYWAGFIKWDLFCVAFTTDPEQMIALVRRSWPCVISMDVDWDRAGREHGAQVAEQLLADPEIGASIVIVFKSLDNPAAAERVWQNCRRPLDVRNPFVSQSYATTVQLQIVSKSSDIDTVDHQVASERSRLQYALLLLHEQEMARACRTAVSFAAVQKLLDHFDGSLKYFGCFAEHTASAKKYRAHLVRQYLRTSGLAIDAVYSRSVPLNRWKEANKALLEGLPGAILSDFVRELESVDKIVLTRDLDQIAKSAQPDSNTVTRAAADGPIDLSFVQAACLRSDPKVAIPSFKMPQTLEARSLRQLYGKLTSRGVQEDQATFRFLLRYQCMHQIEGFLAALWMPVSKTVSGDTTISKSAIQQKFKADDFRSALGGATVQMTSVAKIAELLVPVLESFPPARVQSIVAKNRGRPDREKQALIYDLAAAAAEKASSLETDASATPLLDFLVSCELEARRLPPSVADVQLTTLRELKAEVLTDILLLRNARKATDSAKQRFDFADAHFTLIDRDCYTHHTVLSSRRMAVASVSLNDIVDALQADPLNSAALCAFEALPPESFEQLARTLFSTTAETGIFDYSEVLRQSCKNDSRAWIPVFPLRVNLLSQILSGLHFQKIRIELFCCMLAWSFSPSIAADVEATLPSLAALWRDRGWDRQFALKLPRRDDVPRAPSEKSGQAMKLNLEADESEALEELVAIEDEALCKRIGRDEAFGLDDLKRIQKILDRAINDSDHGKMESDVFRRWNAKLQELADSLSSSKESESAVGNHRPPAQFDPLRGQWKEANLLIRIEALAKRQNWFHADDVVRFEFAAPGEAMKQADFVQHMRQIPEWFRLGWLPPSNRSWLTRFDLTRRGRDGG